MTEEESSIWSVAAEIRLLEGIEKYPPFGAFMGVNILNIKNYINR